MHCGPEAGVEGSHLEAGLQGAHELKGQVVLGLEAVGRQAGAEGSEVGGQPHCQPPHSFKQPLWSVDAIRPWIALEMVAQAFYQW